MPANNLGIIAVIVPVNGKPAYNFARGDSTAALRNIPATGTVLTLPTAPNDGDTYSFSDADGSCSSTHTVTLTSTDHLVQGLASQVFAVPFAWATAQFDGDAGEWMVTSGGQSSGNQGAAQTQAIWWVDPIAGTKSNPGTQALPVDAFSTIHNRNTAGVSGVRPQWNPTGGLVTINVVNTTPVTDPLDVLLDADFQNGSSMIVQGVAKPAVHTGSFTTVSAFARTNAAGQTTITDATVADFHPFVPSLLVDSSANGIGFLALPNAGASATGTISVPYSPQTAGGLPLPTIVTPGNGNNYSLVPLVSVYMGSTFAPRGFPQSHGTFGAPVQINFYRLQVTGLAAADLFHMQPDATAQLVWQECLFSNVTPSVSGAGPQGGGSVFFGNCGFAQTLGNSFTIEPSGNATLYAGGYYWRSFFNQGELTLDQDVAQFATTLVGITTGTSAQLKVGNASFWLTGGPGEALAVEGGSAVFGFSFTGIGVCYGNAPGAPANFFFLAPASQTQFTPMLLRLNPATTFVAGFQFNTGSAATFDPGFPGTCFHEDVATGLNVGPTNPSLAFLDASPAAAGTALDGNAINLTWGTRIVKG